MIELDDLICAGCRLVGPVRAHRFTGFALAEDHFAPESVLIDVGSGDAVAQARLRASAAVIVSREPRLAEWDPTILVAPDPVGVVARWVVGEIARHRVQIALVAREPDADSPSHAERRWPVFGAEAVVVGLRSPGTGDLLTDLVALANALARRAIGVRVVVAITGHARAAAMARYLGAPAALPGDAEPAVPVTWRLTEAGWSVERGSAGEQTSLGLGGFGGNVAAPDQSHAAALAWARVSPERAT